MGGAAVGGAAVGGASAAGRASVGRAVVGARPGFGGPGGPGRPPGPPNGPGPDLLGGAGRGSRDGRKPNKRRRTNVLIAAFAAFIMLAVCRLAGGTYWTDSVALPAQLPQRQSTKTYFNDGATEMARIGEENRTLVTSAEIPEHVKHAVVAAEDNNFYTHSGVDYKGIARAAWNNVTGGDTQGASTITQQYARNAFDEPQGGLVLAEGAGGDPRLEDARSTPRTDPGGYLNTVFFGRNAYGIEAAAWAYFGKPDRGADRRRGHRARRRDQGPERCQRLRPVDQRGDRQGAVQQLHQAEHGEVGPSARRTRTRRSSRRTTSRPTRRTRIRNCRRSGVGQADRSGRLPRHGRDVQDDEQGHREALHPEEIKNGGFKITTTINKTAQAGAEAAAGGVKGSPMAGQPENVQAALVSVEPGTGRVIAYYGGPKGDGNDYAGWYADPVLDNGEPTGVGRHPPGSTFKIYTLGAALRANISIDSYWDAAGPKDFPKSGRTEAKSTPVSNAAKPDCFGGEAHCMLWEATEKSLNVPFFAVTEKLGAATVLDFAKQAGVKSMWHAEEGNPAPKRIDLMAQDAKAVAPSLFSTEVGIGQYSITVLDHANGTATIAARGLASEAHFIAKVEKSKQLYAQEKIAPKPIPEFKPEMADARPGRWRRSSRTTRVRWPGPGNRPASRVPGSTATPLTRATHMAGSSATPRATARPRGWPLRSGSATRRRSRRSSTTSLAPRR